ncbi:hypothetical protein CRI94_07805 [Longibacter salinarum]|uniref:Zinc-ribbon domain-containing protein n=1 Tax=Longibacter salinarum TaxID=1850348 RepID=A0A2A8CZ03_9BACT|nr:zinc-ribbon domain-containing protein [Longibacter salinarum]PEN13949.1 hypothetical protein CRI94_07805 [Longibacter salinarum]
MAASSRSCPSCGARIPEGADRCDLCGSSIASESQPEDQDDSTSDVGATETDSDSADITGEAASSPEGQNGGRGPADGSPEDPDMVYCNACGSSNPADANFCSQCGAKLEAVPEGTRRVDPRLPQGEPEGASENDEGEEDEHQLMSQQLLLTIGVAVLVLIALFFVTLWSQNQQWGDDEPATQTSETSAAPANGTPATGTPAPMNAPDLNTLVDENGVDLSDPVEQQADSLEQQLSNVDGQVRRTIQEQLVNLYVGSDAFGRAARLQEEMAEETGNAEDWRRSGDLFYNWMEYVGQESNGQNPAIAPIGRRAISSYEKVLEQQPENHDVRTDMATVLLRSNNPMRGVEELNRVLEQDSTFVPARFNKGIALLWIGRYSEAIEQFEAVQDLTGEESPQYQQAERAIQLVKEEMSANGGASPSEAPSVAPTG